MRRASSELTSDEQAVATNARLAERLGNAVVERCER
jgi:hypothetical protein